MSQTITIDVGDGGEITINVAENGEQGEPYECDSVEECVQFVERALGEEQGEPAEEQQSEGPEDYAAAWEAEASKRQANSAYEV